MTRNGRSPRPAGAGGLNAQSTAGGFNDLVYQAGVNQGPTDGFRVITSGSNNLSTCALCMAAAGYSDVTGLGAPNFSELLSHF
jgi:hypothetical protein